MNKFAVFIVSIFISSTATAADTEYGSFLKRNDVQAFMQEMIRDHGFKADELNQWFGAIRPRPDIIESISRPAEKTLPWYKYRNIFLKQNRIDGGVAFWQKHKADLERAEKETGVPAHIIVAILGVETLYNTRKGRHKVLESLTTIAFDYPKRARFFRSELKHFLLLAREEGVDPLSLKGSYAGAMGGPQFISSSFRHYAIDFDHDGKRDIWNNPTDMIGSVANYFKVHKWKPGEPVTYRAHVEGEQFKTALKKGIKPYYRLIDLNKMGINSAEAVPANTKAALIEFEQRNGPEHWLGLNNFYVITRYNHSPMYAMAVYQLSQEIVKQMQQNGK